MFFFVNSVVLLHGFLTIMAASNCFVPAKEVCSTKLPEIPNLSSRHPEFGMTTETSHWTFCDVFAINTSQWYKSETLMSIHCPQMYMCGAKFPIWLNDTNPKPNDGVVNRTACLRDFDTCCLKSYDLTAVNCGEFMAYCFVDLPSSCHQRYCFDKGQVSTTKAEQYSNTTSHGNKESSSTTNVESTRLIYSSTETASDNIKESSVGAMDTSTNVDTASWKYSTTPIPHLSTTKSSAGVQDSSTNAASIDDHNLFTIALSMIGLMGAVICGLLIFIIRRRRMSKVTGESKKANLYDTLTFSRDDTIKGNESENDYRIITLKSPGVRGKAEETFRECYSETQTYKTCFTHADYQLSSTENELDNGHDLYVILS